MWSLMAALGSYLNMRKSDKKMENQLSVVLTEVCNSALKEFTGFQWLTHLVNYDNFPKSLKVVFVFDTNANLSTFIASNNSIDLNKLVQRKLIKIDIKLKDMTKHVAYDTEENCEKNHNGKWSERLV